MSQREVKATAGRLSLLIPHEQVSEDKCLFDFLRFELPAQV